MTLKPADVAAAKKLFEKAKVINIISPDRPDFDSVASNLALAGALEKQKKKVNLLAFDQLPEKYMWLGGADSYISKNQLSPLKHKADVAVMMDMSGPENAAKLLEGNQWVIKDAKTILIDHHVTKSPHAISVSLVDPEAAAATELLLGLLQAFKWPINIQIAELLLVGILFDTNRFYNANTDADVFEATKVLVAAGADFYKVNQRYEQAQALKPEEFKRLAELEQNAQIESGIAYGRVPFAMVEEFGKRSSFVGRYVDALRTIKDAQVAFVTAEASDGEVFVSMRSQPGINIGKIAEKYGGGGHAVAAVARFPNDSIEKAEKTILAEVKKLLI